jgi:hypothetical protein
MCLRRLITAVPFGVASPPAALGTTPAASFYASLCVFALESFRRVVLPFPAVFLFICMPEFIRRPVMDCFRFRPRRESDLDCSGLQCRSSSEPPARLRGGRSQVARIAQPLYPSCQVCFARRRADTHPPLPACSCSYYFHTWGRSFRLRCSRLSRHFLKL